MEVCAHRYGTVDAPCWCHCGYMQSVTERAPKANPGPVEYDPFLSHGLQAELSDISTTITVQTVQLWDWIMMLERISTFITYYTTAVLAWLDGLSVKDVSTPGDLMIGMLMLVTNRYYKHKAYQLLRDEWTLREDYESINR